jgi:hypothetical protein
VLGRTNTPEEDKYLLQLKATGTSVPVSPELAARSASTFPFKSKSDKSLLEFLSQKFKLLGSKSISKK